MTTSNPTPEFRDGIALFDCLGGGEPSTPGTESLTLIFRVQEDTNLYRQAKLPLFDLGREEADADSVLKRPRFKTPLRPDGKLDTKQMQHLMDQQNAFYAGLPTWYIQVHLDQEAESQTDLVVAQLKHLNRLSKEDFDTVCTLSALQAGGVISDQKVYPEVPLPPITHPNPFDAPQEVYGDYVSRAAEGIFQSLILDPKQKRKGLALVVKDPFNPGQTVTLGDLFTPERMKLMDALGFRLDIGDGSTAHILVMNGLFLPAWLQVRQGFIRLNLKATIDLAHTHRFDILSPEEKLLRAVLGQGPTPEPAGEPLDTSKLFL